MLGTILFLAAAGEAQVLNEDDEMNALMALDRLVAAVLAGGAAGQDMRPVLATLNAKEGEGRMSMMHLAAVYGRTEAIEVLAAAGASISGRDEGGETPLHQASAVGQVEAIRALVAAGAALEARLNTGLTPLHVAGYRALPCAPGQTVSMDNASTSPTNCCCCR